MLFLRMCLFLLWKCWKTSCSLGRVWCGCDGADSVGRDLTREQKQLFSQLVERAPSTRSLFIQLRVASATRVSAHNRLALLYCCAAAAISLCVSAPVREQIPKRFDTPGVHQLHSHINCLELLAVRLALGHLKGPLHGKHMLIRTDNTATVAYINRQGGLRSRRMWQLARHLLLWSQKHLRSLRAIHIPGMLNRAADELSRQPALPGEW